LDGPESLCDPKAPGELTSDRLWRYPGHRRENSTKRGRIGAHPMCVRVCAPEISRCRPETER
jgi:hypothetical protein